MSDFIGHLLNWSLSLISSFGYLGVFMTMALDTAAVPIPSEVVLPFAGFAAASGHMMVWLVVVVATLANVCGGLIVYYLGRRLGRPLLEHYGHFFFIHQKDIIKMERWLERHENGAIFISRLLPGVRTYSSLVIGSIKEVTVVKFLFLTSIGSLLWNAFFTYFGYWAGANWSALGPYFHRFSLIIGVAVLALVVYYIYKHIRKNNV